MPRKPDIRTFKLFPDLEDPSSHPVFDGLLPNSITGEHLSQTFGASAGILLNLVPVPKSGFALRIRNNVGDLGDTTTTINGAPSATSVVYAAGFVDGSEDWWNDLTAWDGTNYWGKLVLWNTTRGNSRLIEAVNLGTNTFTTENSSDDWANGDTITIDIAASTAIHGLTWAIEGYVAIDFSDSIATTDKVILLEVTINDDDGALDAGRVLDLHPYQNYDVGKVTSVSCALSSQKSKQQMMLAMSSQRIIIRPRSGNDNWMSFIVLDTWEDAAT